MKDPHLPRIMNAFKTALVHLDETEPTIREMIESHLMDASPEKANMTKKSVDALMGDITHVRTAAVKKAFRHLREQLPSHHDLRPH